MCPSLAFSSLSYSSDPSLHGTRTISTAEAEGEGCIVQRGSKLILDPGDRLGRGESSLALIKSVRAAVSINPRILELRNYDGSR